MGEANVSNIVILTQSTKSLVVSILLILGAFVSSPPPARGAAEGTCIVIDSDAGLDDFRAVAALAARGPRVPVRHIAAVVITEGLARPSEGAGAMQAFLRNSGLQDVPVIQGSSPNEERKFLVERPLPNGLRDWRDNAHRLNGTLSGPVSPETGGAGDVASRLWPYIKDCRSISLLVLGPWTSFLRYVPDILERLERIVVQGRPYPDELGGEPTGFNCTYDVGSCYAAFDLLLGSQRRRGNKLRATWVDIPGGPEACGSAEPGVGADGRRKFAFSPIPIWADELEQAAQNVETGGRHARGVRIAREVAKLLRSNSAALSATSLWDDLAALYLMQPELFAVRGGHVEPCVPATTIRAALTEAFVSAREPADETDTQR